MSWDPEQYLKFADDRGRPFADLLARVAVPDAAQVVDLGCGPGNATATLTARWPKATVLGVDSDPAMVEAAGAAAEPPRLSFTQGDVRTWAPDGPVDVIVSNAVLQWVPGHTELLPRWVAALSPGGALAFQVPRMSGSLAGQVFSGIAGAPRWRELLSGISAPTVGAVDNGVVRPTDEYVTLLAGLGCRVDAWETVYYHVLSGADPVLEWFSSTGLRPFLAALEPDARAEFRDEVADALRAAYPRRSFGTVLPFRRIFVVAHTTA
ncbi:MAG TPA: methyltransferase domain-containing protein [Rugosimonospora sp.]|nr:methyltransferase domain-containing protein [Rugosimonospora sp.]